MIDFWTEVTKPQSTVLDFGTLVDHEMVSHCFDATHQPRYTVKKDDGTFLASFGADVETAVRYTHEARQGYVILCEDGWPVYCCLS